MFFGIEEKLKEIISAETVPAGKLSSIVTVENGGFRNLRDDQYPAMFIGSLGEGNAPKTKHKANFEFLFGLDVYCLDEDERTSRSKLSDIYCDPVNNTGLVPLLLGNTGVTINGVRYRLEFRGVADVDKRPGGQERWSGQMRIIVAAITILSF